MSNLILPKKPKEKNIERSEQKLAHNERATKSDGLLQRSGEMLRDPGEEYLGSAVVHYYKSTFGDGLSCKTFARTGKAREAHVALGIVELQNKLMIMFGKTPKVNR